MEQMQARVGIGIMIFKDNKILLGRRLSSHGIGEFSFPGGHLEYKESIIDCAKREIAEECGVEVENIEFLMAGNVRAYLPKHYVLFGFTAKWKLNEPKNLEPTKCEGWNWYDFENLPEPLFAGTNMMIEAFKSKSNFLDE